MIRQAKFGDIPAISALAVEMYERSKYRDIDTPDMKLLKALIMQSIQKHGLNRDGGACVFVSDRDGRLDGFVIGILDRLYHIGHKLMAMDMFLYAAKKASPMAGVRLFEAFVDWAESVPDVVAIRPSATDAINDTDGVEALFRRKGFEKIGVIYERSVPCRVH